MSAISLKVEFLCGTDIVDAVLEAKELAIKLDLAYVVFKFNGVSISVNQHVSLSRDEILERWVNRNVVNDYFIYSR